MLISLTTFIASFCISRAELELPQDPTFNYLNGEWIYVEDRTEGRAPEQLGPPMSGKFALRAEPGAVILVSGHGSGQSNVRVMLDGTVTEMLDKAANTTIRYRAGWKDGTLTTDTDFVRKPGATPEGLIRREFRTTTGGLLVRVTTTSNPSGSLALYQHAEDIPMPTAATATIGDLKWLSGAWVATRSTGSTVEEHWSPPKGGAMLGTSRSVNASGRMFAFEFLRVVERSGGLVYIAQPGGAAPTEFLLTDLSPTRAVFENPRHDYPKRIAYELSAQGGLTATIGYLKGGTPRKFEFAREEPSDRTTTAYHRHSSDARLLRR
jgi:hypothetical protein